jgi:uncharacterized coiled-coil protein SlyX
MAAITEDISNHRIEELVLRIERRDRRSRRIAVVTTVLPAVLGLSLLYASIVKVKSSYAEVERERRNAQQAMIAANAASSKLREVEIQKRQLEESIVKLKQQIAGQTETLSQLNVRVGGESKKLQNIQVDTLAFANTMNRLVKLAARTEEALPAKVYDQLRHELFPVEQSVEICEHNYRNPKDDDDWYTETLYQNATGLYFLYRQTGFNTGDAGASFLDRPWMTRAGAIAWAKARRESCPTLLR